MPSRSRRLEALRAMAEQAVSPNERAIAKRKLRDLEALEASRRPEAEWERIKRREAEAEFRQQVAREAQIAEIVRRWDRGGYDGVTVRSGATVDAVWNDES